MLLTQLRLYLDTLLPHDLLARERRRRLGSGFYALVTHIESALWHGRWSGSEWRVENGNFAFQEWRSFRLEWRGALDCCMWLCGSTFDGEADLWLRDIGFFGCIGGDVVS